MKELREAVAKNPWVAAIVLVVAILVGGSGGAVFNNRGIAERIVALEVEVKNLNKKVDYLTRLLDEAFRVKVKEVKSEGPGQSAERDF